MTTWKRARAVTALCHFVGAIRGQRGKGGRAKRRVMRYHRRGSGCEPATPTRTRTPEPGHRRPPRTRTRTRTGQTRFSTDCGGQASRSGERAVDNRGNPVDWKCYKRGSDGGARGCCGGGFRGFSISCGCSLNRLSCSHFRLLPRPLTGAPGRAYHWTQMAMVWRPLDHRRRLRRGRSAKAACRRVRPGEPAARLLAAAEAPRPGAPEAAGRAATERRA
jgi:hypothetical protein